MIKKYIYIVGLSEFASRMNFMALTAMLLSFEHTEWYLTFFFLARQIGGIATSFIARKLFDKFDRKKLMFWSDITSGIVVLLPLLFQHPVTVCISAFLLGCTYEAFYISFSASVPDIVGRARAMEMNARIVRISSLVSIFGFIAGGWLTEAFGFSPLIVFDSLSYFIAGIFLLKLRWTEPVQEKNEGTGIEVAINKVDHIVVTFAVISLFYSLAVSTYNYSLPLLATAFEKEALLNGLFWSMVSLGAFVGANIKVSSNVKSYLKYLVLFSLFICTVFLFNDPLMICIFLFFSGVFDGLAQVSGNTILQQIPSINRGSAFAVQALSARCGFLVGFMLCPILATSAGIHSTVWIFQLLFIVTCLILYVKRPKGGLNGKIS